MTGHAEIPAEWFGELLPRVGDELELIVVCRVTKIEQDQVNVGSLLDRGATVGGNTWVTLVLHQLKMNMDELDRITRVKS